MELAISKSLVELASLVDQSISAFRSTWEKPRRRSTSGDGVREGVVLRARAMTRSLDVHRALLRCSANIAGFLSWQIDRSGRILQIIPGSSVEGGSALP
jgi:hypothetical protein